MLRIFLIGYMGVGKTTLGKVLADRTGLSFIDLDLFIEGRYRKTIRQIFDEEGEDAFREIERRALHEVAEFENVIISCGGGTPCFFDNMEYMNEQGETVYLRAETDVLHKHLLMGKSVRPLLLNKTEDEVNQFIAEHLAEREVFYTKAKHILDVSLMDSYDKIHVSVSQLCKLLKLEKADNQ